MSRQAIPAIPWHFLHYFPICLKRAPYDIYPLLLTTVLQGPVSEIFLMRPPVQAGLVIIQPVQWKSLW
jgi:hypothetical protein